MKKIYVLTFITLMLFTQGCCDLLNWGCDCGDVEKADLLFDSISKQFLGEQEGGELWEISSFLFNLAVEAECGTGDARASNTTEQIYYSEDGNFASNPLLVAEGDFDIPSLSAINSFNGTDGSSQYTEIIFLEAGYYLCTRDADSGQVVVERNESNNDITDEGDPGGRGRAKGVVIHVKSGRKRTGAHVKVLRRYTK
jgi:hypothetical protein